MSAAKEVPGSRARRTAILGRLAAGQAVKHAGARISTVGRGEERKREVMDRRIGDAITALVDALGLMRGGAMKIGQMLSMIDMGVIPDSHREQYQAAMGRLRDSAPTVPFSKMRAVIEADLGGRIGSLFISFDEVPIGSASIGQVYRATLPGGREVAVKVQYPGVDRAVRADLKNLGLILRAAKAITPEADLAGLTKEITERIVEELDYELEAQNQRAAARLYRDHPFIVVPDVVTALSGPRVLVTDFFDGKPFSALVHESQEVRNHVGEIIYRFFGGSLWAHGQFSPDPHPGNFLYAADGKVAFLDFGLYRHLSAEAMDTQASIMRAVLGKDAAALHGEMCASGFILDADKVSPELALAYVNEVFWWMATDENLVLTSDQVNASIMEAGHPQSRYFDIARRQNMPPDYLFVVRMIVMVMAAVGELESEANWFRIAREWLFDAEPATELGVLEAQYRSGSTIEPLAVPA